MGKVVLVTGVARQLGGRFVRRIQRDPDVDRVIGVDAVPPAAPSGRRRVRPGRHPAARHRAGARRARRRHRRPHGCARHRRCGERGSRDPVKETNVIGTMQLLGACQKSPTVERLVVKSSTSVYGVRAPRPGRLHRDDPAQVAAQRRLREGRGRGRGVCARVRAAAARCGRVRAAFRATSSGRRADSPARRVLLAARTADRARLRPAAAVRARGRRRSRCCGSPRTSRGAGTLNSGTFNIAGDGVLLLSQCSRRLGRPTVPLLLPAVTWAGSALRTLGMTDFSPGADPAAHPRPGRARRRRCARRWASSRSTRRRRPSRTSRAAAGPGCCRRRPSRGAVDRLAALPCRGRRPRRRRQSARTEERINDGGRQGHSVRRRPVARPSAAQQAAAAPGRAADAGGIGAGPRGRSGERGGRPDGLRTGPAGRCEDAAGGREAPPESAAAGGLGAADRAAGWRFCAGGSPGTTRSTSSATTRSSPTRS